MINNTKTFHNCKIKGHLYISMININMKTCIFCGEYKENNK